ncbi:MAG: GDP-mannose 4,6-dehydratase [Proteobacteria bacterium]|nr:GDP-mannose 4,6-dehydratase [Pseudomonadota bacterium]
MRIGFDCRCFASSACGRVVSNFVVQALLGRDISIHGDGAQTRSFCYVDDTIDALIRLMDTGSAVTGPVNIGNPSEIAIADLAGRIIAMTGSASCLVRKPLPLDDPRQRLPDISRARRDLDWEPGTPLEAGLARTIAYFKDLLREDQVRDRLFTSPGG